MRLGSGRPPQPPRAATAVFGRARSWNSSDYKDIEDFLTRMGRRARDKKVPAAGAGKTGAQPVGEPSPAQEAELLPEPRQVETPLGDEDVTQAIIGNLPATTVRAELRKGSGDPGGGGRTFRRLATATILLMGGLGAAAWWARPEVLFGGGADSKGPLSSSLASIRAQTDDPRLPSAPPPVFDADAASGAIVPPALALETVPLPLESETAAAAENASAPDRTAVADGPASADAVARPTLPPASAESSAEGSPDRPVKDAVRPEPGPEQSVKAVPRPRVVQGAASAEIVDASPDSPPAEWAPPHVFAPPTPLPEASTLPQLAPDESMRSRVFLNIRVTADGRTDTVEIVDASRDTRQLSAALVESVRRWRFAPAQIDGMNVASRVLLAFEHR